MTRQGARQADMRARDENQRQPDPFRRRTFGNTERLQLLRREVSQEHAADGVNRGPVRNQNGHPWSRQVAVCALCPPDDEHHEHDLHHASPYLRPSWYDRLRAALRWHLPVYGAGHQPVLFRRSLWKRREGLCQRQRPSWRRVLFRQRLSRGPRLRRPVADDVLLNRGRARPLLPDMS